MSKDEAPQCLPHHSDMPLFPTYTLAAPSLSHRTRESVTNSESVNPTLALCIPVSNRVQKKSTPPPGCPLSSKYPSLARFRALIAFQQIPPPLSRPVHFISPSPALTQQRFHLYIHIVIIATKRLLLQWREVERLNLVIPCN